MYKILIKYLSFFILNSKKRKEFRKKYNSSHLIFVLGYKKYRIKGKNNKVIVIENGIEKTLSRFWVIDGLNIELIGNNNIVKIEFPISQIKNCSFKLKGDNNTISIKKSNFSIENFQIGTPEGFNRNVLIDEDFSVGRLRLWIEENNSSIIIGKDCMFSHDLFFRNSDGHCIFDRKGQLLNIGKDIVIGNHVWIGAFVKILKNVTIPDGCIVGCGSLVNKKFTEKNVVIAGNPAKVVKKDISWTHENINSYMG